MNRSHARGVLQARPQTLKPAEALQPGSYRLDLPARRADNVLYIPATCRRDRPAPLLLLLHGAGGYGEGMLSIFRRQADLSGTPVLAPTAEGVSWDIISGGYGQDVRNIDVALR